MELKKYLRMMEKSWDNDDMAEETALSFFHSFGRYECEIERYFDHGMACNARRTLTAKPPKVVLQEGM